MQSGTRCNLGSLRGEEARVYSLYMDTFSSLCETCNSPVAATYICCSFFPPPLTLSYFISKLHIYILVSVYSCNA